MLIQISGGRLFDPAQGLAGEVRDLFIRDGHIVPGPGTRIDVVYDTSGCVKRHFDRFYS